MNCTSSSPLVVSGRMVGRDTSLDKSFRMACSLSRSISMPASTSCGVCVCVCAFTYVGDCTTYTYRLYRKSVFNGLDEMRTVTCTSLSIVIHCRLMYSCAHQHTCEGVNKATKSRPFLQQHTIQVLPLPIFCILETPVCLLQECGGEEREGRRGGEGEGGREGWVDRGKIRKG